MNCRSKDTVYGVLFVKNICQRSVQMIFLFFVLSCLFALFALFVCLLICLFACSYVCLGFLVCEFYLRVIKVNLRK